MGLLNLVQNVIGLKEDIKVEKTEFLFKEKISREYYLMIKDCCKSHSLAAKVIRQEAIKNKGNVRRLLRNLKSDAGQKARIAHVALCFLRGKKYSEVESNVEDKNRIKFNQLNDYLNCYIWGQYRKYISDDIKKFLEE